MIELSVSCIDEAGTNYTIQPRSVSGCFTFECCTNSDGVLLTWKNKSNEATLACTSVIHVPNCCLTNDSDGDGYCDEDDCWPDDRNRAYGPGDACDDGNPLTQADAYNENCICVGVLGDPVNCVNDVDGDGFCDEDEC